MKKAFVREKAVQYMTNTYYTPIPIPYTNAVALMHRHTEALSNDKIRISANNSAHSQTTDLLLFEVVDCCALQLICIRSSIDDPLNFG